MTVQRDRPGSAAEPGHGSASEEFAAPSRLIAGHAERSGGRLALSFGGERWSYAQLCAAVDALAGEMRAAGPAGERVALMMPNRPETVLAYLACFTAGAVAAPLNARYAPPEIERVLRRARPSWLILHVGRLDPLGELDPVVLDGVRVLVVGADDRHEPLAPLLVPRASPRPEEQPPDQPAVLFFTSGSTAAPKGAPRPRLGTRHADQHLRSPRRRRSGRRRACLRTPGARQRLHRHVDHARCGRNRGAAGRVRPRALRGRGRISRHDLPSGA